MRKRFIAIFLLVHVLCSMIVPVSANEQESSIVPNYEEYCYFVEKMDRTEFNPEYRLYLSTLDACSEWDVWIERASWLIEEDLSVERCTEILANMVTLMNYQLEDAIVEQSSADTTKTLLDYSVDLADIASGAIGTEVLQKGADAVMKRIAAVAGIADGFLGFTVDSKEDLELLLQLEGDYMMQYNFLETVYMYSEIPEMREAAQSLILANNRIMEYKLDTIISIGGSFAKFEAHDVFLDQVAGELFEDPDFWDTETFPLWTLAKVYEYYSTAKLAFDITLFLGNTLFGTSDVFNRYNEMLAMRDIRNALLDRVKANPALNETDHDNMARNISFMKMALYVDARGEYCVYKMVTEDGQLLSYFSCSNDKSLEENYQISLSIIQNTLETLDSIFVVNSKGNLSSEFGVQEIGEAIIEASQFAWNWFYYPKEVDQNDVIEMYDGEMHFYAVTAEGIKSVSDLRKLARTYYAESVVDFWMIDSYCQFYIEQDGKLYISEPWGLGGPSPDALYVSVSAISDSNYEITIYELYHQGTPYEELRDPEVIHYYLEDGHWIFDTVLCYMGESVPVYPYESR